MLKRPQKIGIGIPGQSIVEYLLLVTAVITALLLFLGRGGVFEQSYRGIINQEGNQTITESLRIFF